MGSTLSEDDQAQIKRLVAKYNDIFALNPRKPTVVTTMEHRIITEDSQPIRRKPYRIPYAWNEELSSQIQQMLDNDIIRPSSSPWNSPVILVKKRQFNAFYLLLRKILICFFMFMMLLTK